MAGCMDTFAARWDSLVMPNAPRTPNRSVRVPEDLWAAARVIAAEHGETVTDVIVRALAAYVRTKGETTKED